jgi:hypothetical protein
MTLKNAENQLSKICFESRLEWDGSGSVRFGKRGLIVKNVPKSLSDQLAMRLNAQLLSFKDHLFLISSGSKPAINTGYSGESS